MGKDPAFLFYSDKWITGTSDLLPEEKGVFIDLLAYQHTKGLPTDTRRLARMVSLGHDEFLEIWETLKPKFDQADNQMVNQKLNKVVTDREAYANKLAVTGTFAACIRTCGLSQENIAKIKKAFDIELFKGLNKKESNLKVKEWFNQLVNQLNNQKVIQMDNNLKDKDKVIDKDINEDEKKITGTSRKYDPELLGLVNYLKEKVGSLDGEMNFNIEDTRKLLNKVYSDFPTQDASKIIKGAIDNGLADSFWAGKITSMGKVLKNFNQLRLLKTKKERIDLTDLSRFDQTKKELGI